MRRTVELAAVTALILGLAVSLTVTAGESTPPQIKRASQIDPYYPATAMLTRTPAIVTLLATVRADGRVAGVEVVGCDRPDLGFEQSAVEAVRYWKFKPGIADGQAVEMQTYLLLEFRAPGLGGADESTLARTIVAPAIGNSMLAPMRVPGASATGAALANATAAVTTPGPISIAAIFPDLRGQKLVDKSEYSAVQRHVVPLPGTPPQRGANAPVAQAASRR